MALQPMKHPMSTPDYTIPENYTTDDLRAIAVRAMRDMLSIPWQADRVYEYRNRFDAPHKLFHFEPGMVYAGLPYANAHTGIFQWMCYYDQNTGLMSFPGDGQTWGTTLGTVCANCILWAWSVFSNSIGGRFNSFNMNAMNHFLPVGGYRWPSNIEDLRHYSTQIICEDNGKDAIMEAYAAILPGDGLTTTPDGHAVMAIEKPNIVRLPDGSIDPNASTLMIQDQRGGVGDGFYERTENGVTYHFCGRIDHVFTFEELWKVYYIPVTTAELAGLKPVTTPWISYVGQSDTVESFLGGAIHTNYLLCNLEAILVLPDGTESRAAIALYKKADIGQASAGNGVIYTTARLNTPDLQNTLRSAPAGSHIRMEATLATGGLYVLAQIPL